MLNRLTLTALLGTLLTLTGCASTLSVTYHSDPPGAVLYQEQQHFGRTPVTLNYQIRDEDKKRGYMNLTGPTVRWASGASAHIPSIKADLSIGTNQQFTFTRPDSFPGRELDVRFALELEKLALMRKQLEAQEDQAFWQMFNTISQQNQYRPPPIRNCSSTLIGNVVNTTCY